MAEAVEGLKKLNRALKQLPAKAAKRALKSGARAGGREIVKQTRQELKKHNDTGNLSKSISVKVLPLRKFSVTAIIGPVVKGRTRRGRKAKVVKNDGWYAHFVEYGTAPHKIKPKNKEVLSAGGTILGKEVDHPGTKPRPFMRPGFDKSKAKAVDMIGKKLWDAIKREAAKLK